MIGLKLAKVLLKEHKVNFVYGKFVVEMIGLNKKLIKIIAIISLLLLLFYGKMLGILILFPLMCWPLLVNYSICNRFNYNAIQYGVFVINMFYIGSLIYAFILILSVIESANLDPFTAIGISFIGVQAIPAELFLLFLLYYKYKITA
jgi:hypothetical protein